jgi:hypothetical protein
LVPLATIPTVNGRAWITIQNLTVGTAANPWGPVGSTTITTNATLTTYLTNSVVGDYIILPPNLCSAAIIASQLTNVVSFTNIINSATNTTITSTNSTGGTNAGTLLSFEQDMITYFTNHAFIILPVTCPPANVSLYEGVERISFVRRDYDSLLGRFFSPITNTYVLNSITNSVLLPQTIQRTVTAPDFLFNAADMAGGPNSAVNDYAFVRPSINFNTANAIPGLAGPGTIEPSTTLTFNKVGPIYLNFSPNAYFISSAEANQFPFWIWGSFDGTTNAPVVYPNGTTIANMENQILMGIGPESLPAGQVGVPYDPGSPTFTGTGGQPPYTWSLSPTSPGLPPFVHLTPDGTLHPVDTPTGAATYDFTIRMTDAGARFVERAYSITINP